LLIISSHYYDFYELIFALISWLASVLHFCSHGIHKRFKINSNKWANIISVPDENGAYSEPNSSTAHAVGLKSIPPHERALSRSFVFARSTTSLSRMGDRPVQLRRELIIYNDRIFRISNGRFSGVAYISNCGTLQIFLKYPVILIVREPW
jgi:hypothetical protein